MAESELDHELRRLFLAARSGDRVAYRSFLQAIAPRLRSGLRRHDQGLARSGVEVEDVVQETLLALHVAQASYDPSVPVLVWASAIARYKMVDIVRRAGRRPMEVEIDLETDTNEASPGPDVVVGLDLERALSELPGRTRQLIEDVKVSGYSMAEAGERAGMSEGAVKVALHRALKTLARRLARWT